MTFFISFNIKLGREFPDKIKSEEAQMRDFILSQWEEATRYLGDKISNVVVIVEKE